MAQASVVVDGGGSAHRTAMRLCSGVRAIEPTHCQHAAACRADADVRSVNGATCVSAAAAITNRPSPGTQVVVTARRPPSSRLAPSAFASIAATAMNSAAQIAVAVVGLSRVVCVLMRSREA